MQVEQTVRCGLDGELLVIRWGLKAEIAGHLLPLNCWDQQG